MNQDNEAKYREEFESNKVFKNIDGHFSINFLKTKGIYRDIDTQVYWTIYLTACRAREADNDELNRHYGKELHLAAIELMEIKDKLKDRDQEIRRLNNSYNDLLAKCGDEEGLRLLGNSILLRDVEKLTLQLEKAEEVIGYYADEVNWYGEGAPFNENKNRKMIIASLDTEGSNWVGGKRARDYFKNKEVL